MRNLIRIKPAVVMEDAPNFYKLPSNKPIVRNYVIVPVGIVEQHILKNLTVW